MLRSTAVTINSTAAQLYISPNPVSVLRGILARDSAWQTASRRTFRCKRILSGGSRPRSHRQESSRQRCADVQYSSKRSPVSLQCLSAESTDPHFANYAGMDAYQQRLARRLARSRMRSEPSAFLGTSEHIEQYMLAAYDMDLGHTDALYELERQEEREILRDSLERKHDFKFLDQVLTDFLRTNYHVDGHDDKPWILQELLQIESPHPGKFFEYINRNIRWTSTVWRREGTRGKEICLKLHNDGFRYLSRPGEQIGRHTTSTSQQPGWLKLPWSEVEATMPTLVSTVLPLYRGAMVWYNLFLKKVDLEFVGAKDLAMPTLLIGYEGGFPAYDVQREAHWF